MKLRIALLEDEEAERKITEEFLSRFSKENDIGYELTALSKSDEFLKLDFNNYDLVLLDIILNEQVNGIDVAKKIRLTNTDIPIMFITKTAQFAVDSYDVDAIDYILKPLSYFEFSLKIKKALKRINKESDKILTFKSTDGIITLKENDILYFEIIKHYLYIHLKDKTHIVRGTMKELSATISNKFARPSNSFLVNLKYVKEINKQEVILTDSDSRIPLTRMYKDSFLLAFSSYIN